MRKLLLIADSTYVMKDENGKLYCGGAFPTKVWKRYLDIAENINFVCRENQKVYHKKEAETQFQKLPSNRVNVIYLINPKSNIKAYFNPLVYKKNKEVLKKAIQESDGVIIRTLGCVRASYVIQEIKKNKKIYMYECVGNSWDALWNYGLRGKILAPSAYIAEKELAENANYVLYVTGQYLQSWYPTNSPQIALSDVDIPNVTDDVLINRMHKIEKQSTKFVLGTIGSVEVTYKGQEFVIHALGELARKGVRDIEYQLVGKGNIERLKKIALEEHVDDKVIFLGEMSHESVLNWLDTIDLYIQPSLLEGMPRSVIEAMSRALPCFGSRVGGIPELLDTECMFTKKKVSEIVKLIDRVSIEFMKKQAQRNFDLAKQFITPQKGTIRTEFYEEFNIHCMLPKGEFKNGDF